VSPVRSDSADARSGDRILEVFAVLLLGMATLGSAWCAYQASQWNGKESSTSARSSDERVEGSRLFSLATQEITYDSIIVAQYAQAVASGNTNLQAFYRATLIRPEFIPVLDKWEDQLRAGQPADRLLEDPAYIEARFVDYTAAQGRAEVAGEESRKAAQHADDYVLLTVLFASALFFAGITTSFRARLPRLMLLLAAGITLAYCAGRLVDLPMA
jgi:hypothetical protein